MKNDVKQTANALMLELIGRKAQLSMMQGVLEDAIVKITRFYAGDIRKAQEEVGSLEGELIALARENKETLFKDTDRVDLQNGALLYSVEKRVKRARGVLEKLQALGYLQAIKVAKSVNWDEVNKWNDEKLAQIGTLRVEKENFAYELAK